MDESIIRKVRDIATNALAEWMKKLSASDWEVAQEKDGLVISKSNIFMDKKRPPTWKLECVVDEDPEKLLTMLKGLTRPKDNDIRRKWDKGFDDVKILEKIDNNLMIAHYKTTSGSVVSARDFIDVRSIQVQRKGDKLMHFKIVGTSVDLDKYKPDEHFVRAMTYSSGVQLDRIESMTGKDKTRLLLMNQIDIKGWIPSSVANKAMISTMQKMAKSMIHYAKTFSMF